ncbi:hypothetical protein EKN06_09805 [Croceicoccus ponticola]|uniref:Uncharacterized protein n=1 Tax=Croceicoccus ponticola TaxID=2217664 RepID=A0A437GXY3_9SPHN|nr:hypothetical protein [Croceicoccus ponticola]RVQ66326.1 hypothetical protein EKN06_09805 [Croceicoccus ponticola]
MDSRDMILSAMDCMSGIRASGWLTGGKKHKRTDPVSDHRRAEHARSQQDLFQNNPIHFGSPHPADKSTV